MSFSINSYRPGRDDDTVVLGPESSNRSLPFPTEVWRRMVGGPAAQSADRGGRTPHPAELALEEVERQLERATLSFREALTENLEAQLGGDDEPWRPRAA